MSILTDLFARFRFLCARRREDHELDDELRIHAEMEAEFLRRSGVSEADARRLGLIALGADRGAIRLMVLRRGVAVAWIGIVVGLLGATALAKVFSSVLFHVRPLDPGVLVGAVASMSVVAAVAAFIPAYRATSAEPTTVLH